jgi:hypothetical protein
MSSKMGYQGRFIHIISKYVSKENSVSLWLALPLVALQAPSLLQHTLHPGRALALWSKRTLCTLYRRAQTKVAWTMEAGAFGEAALFGGATLAGWRERGAGEAGRKGCVYRVGFDD